MSDGEISDDESCIRDPMLSDAAMGDDEVPDLRQDLLNSYGDGVLDDDMGTDPELASVMNLDDEEQPLDYRKSPHPLSDSESDDEAPPTKNPLRALLKDAEKVKLKQKFRHVLDHIVI
jgi:hypothetical protein